MSVTEISDDEFDLDRLIRLIRTDVERRRGALGVAGPAEALPQSGPAGDAGLSAIELKLRRFDTLEMLEMKDRYSVAEFLRYHDEGFVRNAYLAILRRTPDPSGLAAFLDQLRNGRASRIDVLASIRYSPEGRVARVPISGLWPRAAMALLRRVPFLGWAAALVEEIVRLPARAAENEQAISTFLQRQRENERHVDANNTLVEQWVNALEWATSRAEKTQQDQLQLKKQLSAVENILRDLRAILETQATQIAEKASADGVDTIARSMEAKADASDVAALSDRVAHLSRTAARHTDVVEVEERVNRRALLLLEERAIGQLAELEPHLEALLAKSANPEQDDGAAHRHRLEGALDAFYRRFEDTFRGSREDIAGRIEVYLPYIAAANAGTDQRPVVDLGCGRGEWLEVLRTHHLTGRGVDANSAMVAECVARGLDVRADDALAHLRALASSSLGGITAMHLVEHLPFREVLALVDEARRVLCPGGVLIMETPNPENVLVGSNTFYLDPTHRRPLPPPLLEFVARYAGFDEVETLRLHPRADVELLTEGESGMRDRLNALFFGPQDYGTIARKAVEAEAPASDDA